MKQISESINFMETSINTKIYPNSRESQTQSYLTNKLTWNL